MNNNTPQNPLRMPTLVALFCLVNFQIGIFVYWFWNRKQINLSTDPAVWGQFGDYIGGILNPIVAFCALLWLMRSVSIQDIELSETRRALTESADAQLKQLAVMQRDQRLAALIALVEATITQAHEARREHDFYLSQVDKKINNYDIQGKPIKHSEVTVFLENAYSKFNSALISQSKAAERLEELIKSIE